MAAYTFYFLRRDQSIPAFDFGECADDEDALRRAALLLSKHDTAALAEVFDGRRIIGRIRRDELGAHAVTP